MTIAALTGERELALPSAPENIVALGIANSGRGLRIEHESANAMCLLDPERCHAAVLGTPNGLLLRALVGGAPRPPQVFASPATGEIIASVRPDWPRELVVVHALPGPITGRPHHPDHSIAVTDPPARVSVTHMPGHLHLPLTRALLSQPVAVAYDAGLAVCFSYAYWQGGGLWDVSVDTHPSHRRRGLARAAVSRLVNFQHERGLAPCWGVPASDPRGLALVSSLGFEPTAEMHLFHTGRDASRRG